MSLQKVLLKTSKVSAKKIINSKDSDNFIIDPFSHVYIDNFFDQELAKNCLKHFPDIDNKCWEHNNDKDIEIKSRTTWKSEFDIPDGIVDVVKVLNSSFVLMALSSLLGIPKLIPDPYFTGGGLNSSQKGGVLDVHVDGNYHDKTGLFRRVNVILFLNENWKKEWGGDLGMYGNNGETLITNIAPIFNRLVIFSTHDKSFHGMPKPLACPVNEARKSLILYYYTTESWKKGFVKVKKPHSALWKGKGFLDKKGNKTRVYL